MSHIIIEAPGGGEATHHLRRYICGGVRAVSRLLFAIVAVAPCVAAEPLLLFNGNVYTADDRIPRAEAVLAVDGRIAFVGTSVQALQRAPHGTVQIDLHGLTVLPGLTDAHVHLVEIGFRELGFNLEGTASLADLKSRVQERARLGKPGEWLTGRGWIESRWTPPNFPTKADLDEVTADRPAVLERGAGHSVLVNSLALERAGITRSSPDPEGGQILKDPVSGEPTGMLIDSAVELVRRLIPPPTDADTLQALEVGAARSVRLGWTQLQIAGNSLREVDLLCQLYSQGRIKLRLYDAIYGPGADVERLLSEGPTDRCDGRLPVRAIKLYIDGALGTRGAALLAPYSDAPDSHGLLLNAEDKLLPILTAALRRGVQVETHAIGDRGNRVMLDLYEKAFATVPARERPVPDPRWRIEHVQVLSPMDIPRFAQLGVIASMQPSHAISDMFFAPIRLGPERVAGAYAWHALLDAGAVIAAGSDAPVEKGDPIIEFYASVVRRSLEGFADADWHAEQRVSRAQALKMLSIWPAYAAFQEKERGTIEVGKQADFSVFSADIMSIPEADILKAHAVMTIIGGEVVHAESGVAPSH